MAYLDRGGTCPSATRIFAALAVNGLMVMGIIYSVPDILPQKRPTVLDLVRVNPDPKLIERDRPDEHPANTASRDIFVPKDPVAEHQAESTGLTISTERASTGSAGGGIIEPLLLGIEPVFRAARPNPRYAGVLQPGYPPGMIREEREGVVTVRVLVGVDGRVKALEAVRADAAAFLEATRKQALAKWRFLPATRDGTPVESWREMTVRFELPD